jgi:hypothetical protein
MNSGKYVFAQLLSIVNSYEFDKCVKRYRGDHRTRDLNCWNQFAQLFFGQLTGRKGLRDICLCLKAHKDKLYHLGIRQNVSHTSLSRANENRDWRIFADFGTYLINTVQPLYSGHKVPNMDIDNDVFALDSTTISLSLTLFSWARGKYSRGAVKMHTLLDLRGNIPSFILITDGRYNDMRAMDEIDMVPNAIYVMDKAYTDFNRLFRINKVNAFFVVPAKQGTAFKVINSLTVDKTTGVKCDQTIRMSVHKTRHFYPEKLRRIKYFDQEKSITLTFLTNNFDVSALEIAQLYKNRWQIELFFKWIKQNLQIKTLWGHSENAVNIHIWIAICTYLIVAYLKIQIKSTLSIYEIMQILGISTFDKTPINELLTEKQIKQNVKEQRNLFNFS